MTVNHSEGPALILASERTGTSSHTVRLPRNIRTSHKLEQQGATSSWAPTFHQGGDTGLGWSQSTSGRHGQVGKPGIVRHPWEVMVIACHVFWGKKHFFFNKKGKPAVYKGSVMMLMKMTYCNQALKWLLKEKRCQWQSILLHPQEIRNSDTSPSLQEILLFTPWDNQGF